MTTLSNYILSTRRLLHDATGAYWSDSELTDYINEARLRVVADTGCNRSLQIFSLVAGQEVYSFSVLPQGVNTIDVLNVTVLWGTMRVPLNYMAFTEFNMKLRAWQQFTARPVAFCQYGQNSVVFGPVPDQTYVTEWDTIIAPNVLINPSDVDTSIVTINQTAIPSYSAYLAKYKEQSYQEADKFQEDYNRKVRESIRSSFTRRMPSVYGG